MKISYVTCGDYHTFFVTSTGETYAVGKNRVGQLGLGFEGDEVLEPERVLLPEGIPIVKISSNGGYGCSHTLALLGDHSVWSWGSGKNGQLGHGDGQSYSLPTKILSFHGKTVTDISTGYLHSCVVASSLEKPKEDQKLCRKIEESGLGAFHVFPNEILYQIFHHLSVKDMINVDSTSHFLQHFAVNTVWKRLYFQKFQADLNDKDLIALSYKFDWKSLYILTFKEQYSKRPVFGPNSVLVEPPGFLSSWVSSFFFRPNKRRFLLIGLDAAGKTTMMYKLNSNVVTYIPTIGFNVETVEMNNLSLVSWDIGGPDRIRPLWRHYLADVEGVIIVVDSADHERINEVRYEVVKLLNEPTLLHSPLLVFANKQDLPHALTPYQVAVQLGLKKGFVEIFDQPERQPYFCGVCPAHVLTEISQGRSFLVQPSVMPTGEGLYEGLYWLQNNTLQQ
eukprot:TRINITY_DN11570_c0_g1_i3.p1 TRINITY_DN11570_c0_g1~~TRINITY_DN11570_c0_g1_i3.p1  ORF type:complete len:449 (-),score=79.77 TRINITY_DN11570_c0_g1_i3:99-1445(-)